MSQDARQLHQLFKIGSARAGRALADPGEPLASLLPPDGTAVEAQLWLGLGALDLWERSGFQPAAAPTPGTAQAIQAAPSDQHRPCPARAEALLALLLRGVHPASLLPEWLQLLQRHGARLPARFLPNLLDAVTRQPALRAQIAPVLDERGRWLARLQPAWGWALAHSGAGARTLLWETGSPGQRVAALRDWRDADPAATRQALIAVWKTEPPEQRALLLPVLAVRLSLEDEPFLETALDDRRKEVRTAAQRLLAQLPGSRLGQRMLARLAPLLQIERRLFRAERLNLTLPAACDPPMQRDGVGAAPHPGLGEKAGWVVDLLAAIDPAVWAERFGRAPLACLALLEDSDFAAVFVRGWALACVRHAANGVSPQLAQWLRDLALWWIDADAKRRNTMPDSFFDALGVACRHDAQDIFGSLLDALPAPWPLDADLLLLLQRLADAGSAAWSPALSRRVLQRLVAAWPLLSGLPHPWYSRPMLASLALALDPAAAYAFANDHASGHGPDNASDTQWRDAFDQFFNTVRFRHEMTLSFQEQA